MTQEEKDLLIKDLFARVYYGIICQCNPIKQIENIDGYVLSKTPSNAEGLMTKEDIEVIP